ncbi:MAG TPA: ThuA domain-containing protein [Caldilineaceae bacterium]|nr:ThuA domain-containing protein [Caldilineaceae bacterium]HRW06702.1 ThuA domain-containing protein [Caldilineaceae bacterium]
MQPVLVLCDDKWHPAKTPREGLGALPQHDFHFDWIENAHDWSAERMATYPLVILTKSNNVSATDTTHWMTDEVQHAFLNYVRQGGGLLAIHSGTAEYREATVLRSLLGGVFLHHPKQCPVTVTPKAGHGLTAGSAAFTGKDEHYFMEMNDDSVDIFLTSSSEHGEQPAGWTRTEGNGRVCVLTPGHNVEVWLEPAYQPLISNAMRWCVGTA